MIRLGIDKSVPPLIDIPMMVRILKIKLLPPMQLLVYLDQRRVRPGQLPLDLLGREPCLTVLTVRRVGVRGGVSGGEERGDVLFFVVPAKAKAKIGLGIVVVVSAETTGVIVSRDALEEG